MLPVLFNSLFVLAAVFTPEHFNFLQFIPLLAVTALALAVAFSHSQQNPALFLRLTLDGVLQTLLGNSLLFIGNLRQKVNEGFDLSMTHFQLKLLILVGFSSGSSPLRTPLQALLLSFHPAALSLRSALFCPFLYQSLAQASRQNMERTDLLLASILAPPRHIGVRNLLQLRFPRHAELDRLCFATRILQLARPSKRFARGLPGSVFVFELCLCDQQMRQQYIEDNITKQRIQHKLNIRQHFIQRSRRLIDSSNAVLNQNSPLLEPRLAEFILELNATEINKSVISQALALLQQQNQLDKLKGLVFIRKLIDQQVALAVVDQGLSFKIIQLASQSIYKQLGYEAMWLLTNMTSLGNRFCMVLADKGLVEVIIEIMRSSQCWQLVELAIWSIGNISAQENTFRQTLIKSNILLTIVRVCQRLNEHQLNKIAAWTISNLVRVKPYPPPQLSKPVIPFLGKFIKRTEDTNLLKDVLWGFSVLAQCHKQQIKNVYQHIDWIILQQVLAEGYQKLVKPTLRLLGNIYICSRQQIETIPVIDFRLIVQTAERGSAKTRKEAFWSLSNLLCVRSEICGQFVRTKDMLEYLLEALQKQQNSIRIQILYILRNIVSIAQESHIFARLKEAGLPHLLKQHLSAPDAKLVLVTLQLLESCFCQEARSGGRVLMEEFGLVGGDEVLLGLQHHPNRRIYQRVVQLLQKFYDQDL